MHGVEHCGAQILEARRMMFYDLETAGKHGVAVLMQYASGEEPVQLHEPWCVPARQTLDLIEKIYDEGVCGFNISFESFHSSKLYSTFRLLDPDEIPGNCIDKVAILEKEARSGPCLKARHACDLMLFSRKGPYQNLMKRDPIRIKRVPTLLAEPLAKLLEQKIRLNPIYFAKRKDKSKPQWAVKDTKSADFKDVILVFNPSGALKTIAADALGLDQQVTFKEIQPKSFPEEKGYAPFALAIGKPGAWNGAWPEILHEHIEHWKTNQLAREYAARDVTLTRDLYKFFGCPEPDDDDSTLAMMIGAVRWKGFAIDVAAFKKLRDAEQLVKDSAPTKPSAVLPYLTEVMNETEKLVLLDETGKVSTKRVLLEELQTFDHNQELVKRATAVSAARKAKYRIDVFNKLILAERFHVGMNVLGTKSSRMSGGEGINGQGIESLAEIRRAFPLADPGQKLRGGDFRAFEVTIADAVYADPVWHADIKSDKKLAAIFGTLVFAPMTYEEVLATNKTKDDKYKRAKSGLFAWLYWGTAWTLKTRLGVPTEIAQKAIDKLLERYSAMAEGRKQIEVDFITMKQREEGGKITWADPHEYVESLFGFKRYFTLENTIAKALFELGSNPPESWRQLKFKVSRKAKLQSAVGAVQSALFGAAFATQGATARASGNHKIQSSGAQLTKNLQRRIWDIQKPGVNEWLVAPLNVHDEVNCVTHPVVCERVDQIVKSFLEEKRSVVPLLDMDWKALTTWAG